jgi:hypothetical protein
MRKGIDEEEWETQTLGDMAVEGVNDDCDVRSH